MIITELVSKMFYAFFFFLQSRRQRVFKYLFLLDGTSRFINYLSYFL